MNTPVFVGLGGEPATGKSTLAKTFLEHLSTNHGELKPFAFQKVRGLYSVSTKIWVVGLYESGEKFPGTDRLSMAVQPDFETFVRWIHPSRGHVFFEGDRLFIKKNFELAVSLGFRTYPVILQSPPGLLSDRHRDRGDSQTEVFLRGRRTKYQTLSTELRAAESWLSERDEHVGVNVKRLLRRFDLIA